MSPLVSSGSYNHRIRKSRTSPGWEMFWTVDWKCSGSRLRFPRTSCKYTEDPKAVERFCKKWGVTVEDPRWTQEKS